MIPEGPLFHKPKSIIAAKNTLYAMAFLSFISSIIGQFTTTQNNFTSAWGLSGSLLSIVLLIFLAHQIGLGRIWARTLTLVIFLMAMAAIPLIVRLTLHYSVVLAFLFGLRTLLQIMVLVFLYSKRSSFWFREVAAFETNRSS